MFRQTDEVMALTASLTPTATFTPTPTATTSATPTATFTPIDATDEYATLLAQVSGYLSATADARRALTQTAAYQKTVDVLLFLTAPPTLTPTPTPLFTLPPTNTPPLNATFRAGTVQAQVEQLLTVTADARLTIAAQATVDQALRNRVSATPTLDLAVAAQTEQARVFISLTQTPQAAQTATADAAIQGTLGAFTNRNATATTTAIRATLTANLQTLSPSNAGQIAKVGEASQQSPIFTASFSPTGANLVTASLDNTVRFWTVDPLGVYAQSTGLTVRQSASYSMDGQRVAVSSPDSSIRVYESATGKEIAALRGHTGIVYEVDYSEDGQWLGSAGADDTVRIWDARTGNSLSVLKAGRGGMFSVTFSPDGQRVVGGSNDGTITIWETKTGIVLLSLREASRITGLTFTPDGNTLIVGTSRAVIQVYESFTAKKGATIRTTAGIFGLAVHPSEALFAATLQDGTLLIFDLKSGNSLKQIAAHVGNANGVTFSPDGARLVTVGADGRLVVWGVGR
jgi:hypothetical protein